MVELSVIQVQILRALLAQDHQPVPQIAARLAQPVETVRALMGRMATDGLVVRRGASNRRRDWTLTPAGRARAAVLPVQRGYAGPLRVYRPCSGFGFEGVAGVAPVSLPAEPWAVSR